MKQGIERPSLRCKLVGTIGVPCAHLQVDFSEPIIQCHVFHAPPSLNLDLEDCYSRSAMPKTWNFQAFQWQRWGYDSRCTPSSSWPWQRFAFISPRNSTMYPNFCRLSGRTKAVIICASVQFTSPNLLSPFLQLKLPAWKTLNWGPHKYVLHKGFICRCHVWKRHVPYPHRLLVVQKPIDDVLVFPLRLTTFSWKTDSMVYEYLSNLRSICIAQTTIGQPAMVGNGQGIQDRPQCHVLSCAFQSRC